MSSPFPTNETLTDSDVVKASGIIELYHVMEVFRKKVPSSGMYGPLELGIVRGWEVQLWRTLDTYSISCTDIHNSKNRVDGDVLLVVRRGSVQIDMPGLDGSHKLNDSTKTDIHKLVRKLWKA